MNRKTDLANSGMTRIQLLILAVLVIIIIGLSLPPFLKDRKISQADVDVETIAKAIKKYSIAKNVYGYEKNEEYQK